MVSGTTSDASEEMTPRVRFRAEDFASEASAKALLLLPVARSSSLDARAAAVAVFIVTAEAEAEAGAAKAERSGRSRRTREREAENNLDGGPFDLAAAAIPELLEGQQEGEASLSMCCERDRPLRVVESGIEEEEKKKREGEWQSGQVLGRGGAIGFRFILFCLFLSDSLHSLSFPVPVIADDFPKPTIVGAACAIESGALGWEGAKKIPQVSRHRSILMLLSLSLRRSCVAFEEQWRPLMTAWKTQVDPPRKEDTKRSHASCS